jgi:cation:H+ antiporter
MRRRCARRRCGFSKGDGFDGRPYRLLRREPLLSPIATEMPETMNAIIWVRQGKERLALANISGAMMIQATVPTAVGLFGTPWLFDSPLIIAGGVTTLAVVALFLMFRGGRVTGKRLSWASLLYLLFAGALLLH